MECGAVTAFSPFLPRSMFFCDLPIIWIGCGFLPELNRGGGGGLGYAGVVRTRAVYFACCLLYTGTHMHGLDRKGNQGLSCGRICK